MLKLSKSIMAVFALVTSATTVGLCPSWAASDYVRHDAAVLLHEARTNFSQIRGPLLAGGDDKTARYPLNPPATIVNLACTPDNDCEVVDHFAENGQSEYWDAEISLIIPRWAAPDYAHYRANIIRILGSLVPGYTIQESPPYLEGGQGLFSVTMVNDYEAIVFHGFIGDRKSVDLIVYHNAVGKTVHRYVRPKPLDAGQLHALGGAFSMYALKGIRRAANDFAGYHPVLTDRRYGKDYYNVAFVSSPYIKSCDIHFDQGINRYFNQYGRPAPQGWSVTCNSKAYENGPHELLGAVASVVESALPAGFTRTSIKKDRIEWKDQLDNMRMEVYALKNRPSDTHPHRAYVGMSIYHGDRP